MRPTSDAELLVVVCDFMAPHLICVSYRGVGKKGGNHVSLDLGWVAEDDGRC